MKYRLLKFDYGKRKIRAVQINGEAWFALKDVCSALGLGPVSTTVEQTRPWELRTFYKSIHGSTEVLLLINATGLNRILQDPCDPESERFRAWLNGSAVPSTIWPEGDLAATGDEENDTDEGIKFLRVQSAQLLADLAKEYRGTRTEQVLHAYVTKKLTGKFLIPPLQFTKSEWVAGKVEDYDT